jgi:hypothetical protein
METEFFSELLSRIVELGLAKNEDIIGCTDDEILSLERDFNIKLPKSYRLFLMKMGKGAGRFIPDECLYYNLFSSKSDAQELLLECGAPISIEEGWFVYYFNQYNFFFFDTCLDNSDPEVFRFIEGNSHTVKEFNSFTAWLADLLQYEEEIAEELGIKPGTKGTNGVRHD